MRSLVFIIGASLVASLFCLGCGGGGSDRGGKADLQGTWLGWIEDDEGTIQEFSLQVDGDGNVLDAQIGASNLGTGHINEGWDENVFHLLYSRHGIMIVDDQFSHATYGDYGSVDSGFHRGVLEKGVAGIPAYAASDIVATYPVGGAYEGSSGVWEGESISMTVNPDLTFTGTAPEGGFSGGFDEQLFDPVHGRYAGTLTRGTIPPVTMDITAYISPDGTAVALFAAETGTVADELEDFLLMGLKKP